MATTNKETSKFPNKNGKFFKNLIIWQKGQEIFGMVCEDVKKWPNDKIANAISYQILDSSGSISANVAEGYGRGGPREFEQFLRYSRGSTTETEDWMFKAMTQGLITAERYNKYELICTEENKMISSFINKVRGQKKRTQ